MYIYTQLYTYISIWRHSQSYTHVMYPYPTICTFSSTDQFSCCLMQLFPKLLEGPTLIGGPQTGGAVG